MKALRFWWVGLLVLIASAAWSQQAGLKIVVLQGEDAVNIIMQNTAVQPVVEVRDRNNLPVAGALVVFLIRDGKAATFANKANSITVTTDATGRAAANGLQAIGKGTLRIQAQASFQGQTASTTISQSNFATVADAAKAGKTVSNQGNGAQSGAGAGTAAAGAAAAGAAGGAAGGASGGAAAGTATAGAAGGAGGGLSTAATVGIIGGAAAGGAVAIKAATGGSSSSSSSSAAAPICTTQANETIAAINAESAACAMGNSSSACFNALQNTVDALGRWCTCLGTSGQLTAADRQLIQQTIQGLEDEGFSSASFASCSKL